MASRTVVPGARHWPLAALLLASVLWGGVLSASLYSVVAKRFADDSDALSLTTWHSLRQRWWR